MTVRVLVLIGVLAGCGRFDFTESVANDAASDASPDVAVDAALPVCNGCMLASSEPDYSGAQGTNGWYYGYWWAETDSDGTYDPQTDFTEMTNQSGLWRPPDFDPTPGNPGFTWAYMAAWGGHPGGSPAKLPIRRWVSAVSGLASVTVHHAKSDPTGGDGTRLIVFVDGTEVWRHDVEGMDGVGVTEEVPVVLRVGTKIDVMLHYIINDSIDTTDYSAIVHGP